MLKYRDKSGRFTREPGRRATTAKHIGHVEYWERNRRVSGAPVVGNRRKDLEDAKAAVFEDAERKGAGAIETDRIVFDPRGEELIKDMYIPDLDKGDFFKVIIKAGRKTRETPMIAWPQGVSREEALVGFLYGNIRDFAVLSPKGRKGLPAVSSITVILYSRDAE